MRQMILIPDKYFIIKKEARTKKIKIITLITLMTIIILLLYYPFILIENLSSQKKLLEYELLKVEDKISLFSEYDYILSEISERRKNSEKVNLQGIDILKIFNHLGKSLPKGVSIVNINFSDSNDFYIIGSAISKDDIAQYIESLKNDNYFSSVRLSQTLANYNTDSGVDNYSFRLEIKINTRR
ncbi:PilN domain-containing protein [Herbivorax sp. ANBcel31]|uniref:PilN domain-containing protein n=1 Tax=Herbivorax sp. ANBcel31 TaxID=3069754 RepID=UPI0027B4E6BE|nr:PilN domain-containing protein [Herbivorax sp. ANBcel31]MDQ2087062.1 PilN domain-containing protein [Herbivorax sp. ANBcel31]